MAILLKGHPFGAHFYSTAFPQITVVDTTRRTPALAYDAATDENGYWLDGLDRTPSGTITFKAHGVMATATTGSVRLQVAIQAVTPGDALDLDSADSFDTDNSGGATVPATAGHDFEITFTLTTLDSWASGDDLWIRVRRDADGTSGTDDAAGDYLLLRWSIQDTA